MGENLYQHLSENEAIFREAMHIAKIGSWKWDLKTKEITWSDEMYHIFGIDKETVTGRLGDVISNVVHPEDLSIFQNTADIVLKKPFVYRIIQSDQSIHYILAKTGNVTFAENGEPAFLVGIVQDITEQKNTELALIRAKENAEEENAAKSHFFATMSHEFRTPITVMLSSIQLFEQYIQSEAIPSSVKIAKHLKAMRQNSLRLLRLVNNLIDISKIDTGFYSPVFKNYDIVGVIGKIVLSVQEYAKQKNIDIDFKSSLKELLIRCDADMIERIMLNLISNAIKFSSADCLIQIFMYRRKDFVYIVVKDNGIGIEAHRKDIIFERYNRIQTTRSRTCEGSGIGLSITKSLVEMHNGKISVSSPPGKGSKFTIKLPCSLCPGVETEKTIETDAADNHSLILKMNVEFSDIYL